MKRKNQLLTVGLGIVALFLALVLGLGSSSTAPASAQGPGLQPTATPARGQAATGFVVGHSSKNDTSAPLRSIPARPLRSQNLRKTIPLRTFPSAHVNAPDTAIQTSEGPLAMPGTILNFDGMKASDGGGYAPPDTNGEAGATQYVQMVNIAFEVFDKTNGNSLLGPLDVATIWSGFGGVCETGGMGDVIVVYDQLANRWVISQMAGDPTVPFPTPTDECVAVSTGSDATGSYHRYDFFLGGNFPDYPKLSVWPDAYFLAENMFDSSGTIYLGPQPFALNRAAMLAGNPATFVTPSGPLGPSVGFMLSADLDGSILPPAGAPNPWLATETSPWRVYRFHADFATPSNSTFTLGGTLTPASYTDICSSDPCDIVPQAGTGDKLDAIADRAMFRLAYRRFGDGHEALVGNRTVGAGTSTNPRTGIRWWEITNATGGTPAFVQQSTLAPNDGMWRWMGSVAMDKAGNLALGVSLSSSTTFPQIRYNGRLATDPLNTLAQGGQMLFAGTGSQIDTVSRWGDYSDMTIDPVDDCTFWYTNQYYAVTSSFNWRTRIGKFQFPSCLGGVVNTPTPTPTRTSTPIPGQSTITVENEDYRVLYDGWLGVKDANASQGTFRVSSTANDKVTFNFSGSPIAWMTLKGPAEGIAQVTVDGNLKCNCDLYNPAPNIWKFTRTFSGLGGGAHTLVIKVTGNKNSSATAANIVLDSLATSTTVQDKSYKIQYNNWRGVLQSAASGGSYRVNGTLGSSAGVRFTGGTINWTTAKGPVFGKADVYVDNVKRGATIDLYDSHYTWKVTFPFTGLGPGPHTIQIRPLETKNPASGGTGVVVDSFRGPILTTTSPVIPSRAGVLETGWLMLVPVGGLILLFGRGRP